MGEVFQTVPLKTNLVNKKVSFHTIFFNLKCEACVSLSVSHSVGFPLRVGLSAGGGLPSFQCAKTCSSLTLSLSPFTSCCLCYSERMLPVCDASRESSTCVLLQAAFPLGLILSLLVPTHPHTQPHSCPPLYPSPLFKHSVLIHMLRGIPILLP